MTGQGTQKSAPAKRRPKKGNEPSSARSETQSDKAEAARKPKGKASPNKQKKGASKDKGSSQASPNQEADAQPKSDQPQDQEGSEEGSQSGWDLTVESTLQTLADGLKQYEVANETPLASSMLPQVISDDIKVVQQEDCTPEPTNASSVTCAVHYEMPVLQLLALASTANKDHNIPLFKVVEAKSLRSHKSDESRHRNSAPKDHQRHHDQQLTPFDYQSLQATYPPGADYPGDTQPNTLKPFTGWVGKQDMQGKDKAMQKGPHGGKLQPTNMNQGGAKSRSANDGKWLMPTATDGIFSLGSIKDDDQLGSQPATSGTNLQAADALKNITQILQDMKLKKKASQGAEDDVINISTKDVSSFTFFDEGGNTPLKSSQFSKFFSTKLESVESATPKPEAAGESVKEPANDVEAETRNRQRANQLLQLMMSRKSQ